MGKGKVLQNSPTATKRFEHDFLNRHCGLKHLSGKAVISYMKTAKIFIFFIVIAYVGVFSNAENISEARDFRRIYVARHGQRTSGGDPSLTRLGVEQAKLLARRIQEIGFDGKIYASPYLRTVETASEIAKLFGIKMILTPEIQERTHKEGIPDIKGRSLAELDNLFPSLISKDSKLPNNWVYADNFGEKLDERVAIIIEKALEGDSGDFILVGHKATVKAALKYLCEKANCQVDTEIWNCELAYFIALPDGSIKFVSSGVDFIPPGKVTNNFKRNLLGQKPPSIGVKNRK